MIKVKTIKNIFELEGRRLYNTDRKLDKPLSSYIPDDFLPYKFNLRVAHNQTIVDSDKIDNIIPKDGDEITIAIKPLASFLATTVLYYVIIPFVVGKIIGSTTGKPSKPSAPSYSTSDEFADSVTYGFEGIRNTAHNGQPIGVVYGQHKVGGQIIQLFNRSPQSNKDELYMLIGLCEGCIQDIAGLTGEQNNLTGGSIPSGIKINNNPASQYAGVFVSTRIGANDQSVIQDFRNVTTNVYQGVALVYNSPIARTTGQIQAYEINLNFPSGLYQVLSDGGYGTYAVSFSIRHKKAGGSWSTPVIFSVSNRTRSALSYTYRKDGLEIGIYDIEITRTTADDGSTTVSNSNWESHNETTYDDLKYPNIALLAVRAVATEQLSGGTPTITAQVKGKLVWVWNGDTPPTFTQQWSDNPAWCLMDLLIDKRYGLGEYIDIADIVLQSFKDFADYCDTPLVADGLGGTHKRCLLNIVFDGSMSAWDAINVVCASARASLIKSGKKIRVKVEKAESPVQLFTMGNIVKGSLKIKYTSIKDRANFLEVQFLNESNDYEQDIVSIEDPASFAAGEDFRKETVALYGITRPAQAYREAIFNLNVNRYLKRIIEFEAGIDAIACEPGDVINFQHDLPQWGYGGRVVSGTTGSVTLDQSVTIEPAKTYKVRVRHKDDTQEEKTVTNIPGTHTILTIVGTWTTIPEDDEIFAFGETSLLVKPFRIVEISRASDLTRKIIGLEYNSNIYADTFGDLEELTYTQLPDPLKLPADISDLELSERVMLLNDGTLKNVIDVNFILPSQNEVAYADIFWREQGTGYWEYIGTSKTGYAVIQDNVSYGKTYEVAVASVSIYGTKKKPESSPSDTITIQGKTIRPPDITGLLVVRIGDILYFEWNEITDKDLKCYEIRVGSNWESAIVFGENISENRFQTTNFSPGLQTFMVKAKNTSDLYSLTPALYVTDVDERINQNVVLERNEKALNWPGEKVNMTMDGDGNLQLDEGEASGYYITPVIDVGNDLTSRVYIDYRGNQRDTTLTWELATFAWNSSEAQTKTWAGPTEDVKATSSLSFRISLDNITWSDWQNFIVGEYQFQYIQIRVDVSTNDLDYLFTIERMNTTIDVPDIFDSGEDVAIDSAGANITFNKTFTIVPAMAIGIQGGEEGDTFTISNKTVTGFTVRVFNSDGVPQNATIDWVVRGY